MITVGQLAAELGLTPHELTQYAALHTWYEAAKVPDGIAERVRQDVAAERTEEEAHRALLYWTCGCKRNASGAHRASCMVAAALIDGDALFLPCGCLRTVSDAHRVGCPTYPEGVRP